MRKLSLVLILLFTAAQQLPKKLSPRAAYALRLEIHPFNKVNKTLLSKIKPAGIILSGGPNSVLDKKAPLLPKAVLDFNKPILGVCYGIQLLTKIFGGKINKSINREYGFAKIKLKVHSEILPKKWIKNNQNIFN